MATIEQRPSADPQLPPSWRVYWRRGGRKGRKESATFPTSQLADTAQALAASRRHQITAEEVYRAVLGLTDDDLVPTLADFATSWLQRRRQVGDVEGHYLDGLESIIRRRITPRLGQLRLRDDQITPDVVADWVAWLRSQPGRARGALAAATVREAHVVLHALLAAAVPKHLSSNPAKARAAGQRRKSGLPKIEPYEAVFLTQAEIDLILAACPSAIRDLVLVSVLTGLRLGELLVLRVKDVTLTGRRRVIQVRGALKKGGTVGAPKSRRSRRDVTLSARVVRVLERRVEGRPGHALLFPAPRGGRWNPSNLRQRYWLRAIAAARRCPEHPPPTPPAPVRGPRRAWRVDEVSTCDCAGRLHRVPRWHDLRHTHVSLCVEDGWDPVRVSRRVGHESYNTTVNIYGHLWDLGGDEQVDGLDRHILMAEDEQA